MDYESTVNMVLHYNANTSSFRNITLYTTQWKRDNKSLEILPHFCSTNALSQLPLLYKRLHRPDKDFLNRWIKLVVLAQAFFFFFFSRKLLTSIYKTNNLHYFPLVNKNFLKKKKTRDEQRLARFFFPPSEERERERSLFAALVAAKKPQTVCCLVEDLAC